MSITVPTLTDTRNTPDPLFGIYVGQVVRVGKGTALWSIERLGNRHADVCSERGRWDRVDIDRLTVADLAPEPYCPYRHFERYEPFGWRLEHFDFGDLGAYGYTFFEERRLVQITTDLLQREERCTLAHEVAHIERGYVHRTSDAAVEWDEREVENVAALRLIRLDDLLDAARWAHDADQLAEELCVSEDLLNVRVRLLTRDERARFGGIATAGPLLRHKALR